MRPETLNERPSVWLGAFGLLFLFAFRNRLLGLWNAWLTDGFYSVGALVPLVSAALVWGKRKKLGTVRLEPNVLGLIVLFATTAGATMLPSTGLLFAAYWAGVALVLGGFPLLRELVFPIALLFFVKPLPAPILNIIDYPFQMVSATITARLATIAGVEVIQEGPIIRLANTVLFISPECNGLRSLVALFLIGLVAAHISKGPNWARILLPVLTVPIAYLSNLVRLFLNVVITNALGSSSWIEYELGYDLFIGLLTFVVACLLFAKIATVLKCRLAFESES